MHRLMAESFSWGVAAACAFCLVTPAQAAPIPLNLTQSLPDIAASQIALSYTAATDVFSATSTAPLVYNPGNLTAPGTYTLSATIDAAGNLVSPGTLTIAVPIIGLSVTGSLTAFGYNPTGTAKLEFTGHVTASTAAGFPVGSLFGVIMNSQINNISFAGDFTQLTTAGVTADNFAATIPEPATLSLLALGVLGIGAARRRR